jgi:hypothetical protein
MRLATLLQDQDKDVRKAAAGAIERLHAQYLRLFSRNEANRQTIRTSPVWVLSSLAESPPDAEPLLQQPRLHLRLWSWVRHSLQRSR